ncbi:hypothetical protein [Mucilaginibacter gotjawali]|uniref:Uncharacterized protein n=2 Tax=Mucilaginibacter gotjawali TaxID=1550579 RepID=A0A0X8X5K3_9SPHI|nr:hypothetical protein [Mucilaginibacter gotjawali]MBB3056920.1 hypothetical protein [Mucilaginibacter gotjawali]BAU56000.1 hypothetical protein MgSA37_04192 [Mucilaginibacter gotjawali]
MNLQAEKLEVVRLILDTDDKNILSEVKALFKNRRKTANKKGELDEFYDGFKKAIHEVKSSIDGKAELKDAKAWLSSL